MSKRYLFLDTETTGLDPVRNDVIEIGAIIFEDNDNSEPVELARYQATMTASNFQLIDVEALQVNGRSMTSVNTDIDMRGSILAGFADWLIEYVNKDTIIVGHNINFDLKFIKSAGLRYNIDFERILSDRKSLDTKQIAMFLNDAFILETKDNRLVTLTNALFGFELNENQHQALVDAYDTSKVYFKMREMI